jgi:hypothetical protein
MKDLTKEAEDAAHAVALALFAAERLVETHWNRPGTEEMLAVTQMILDRMSAHGRSHH